MKKLSLSGSSLPQGHMQSQSQLGGSLTQCQALQVGEVTEAGFAAPTGGSKRASQSGTRAPGLSREPAGMSRVDAARDSTGLGSVSWTSSPHPPKPTGLSHLINFPKPALSPVVAPTQKGLPQKPFPMLHPSPMGSPIRSPPGVPSQVWVGSWEGERQGEREGGFSLLWPSAHWPPEQLTHHRATHLMI